MEKKIAKNGFYLVLGQVISRLIGFFYFIFLARALSVENFGIYAWVLGFVYNFLPVADFGIERYILKNLPRHLD
ncbi:MAG: oligosaccharide flippase family protein, partial [Candidatus Pacebacteria bacterium]|nr:oligosaccharide flippase family protein [Candidatus Paceibacterota bacterium]